MHDEWQPPPIPADRSAAGETWHSLWHAAHTQMHLYDRKPHVHLIDRIARYPDRWWLRDHFGAVALVTLGSPDSVQPDGRRRFTCVLPHFATMKSCTVRVVLDMPSATVFNAIVVRRQGPRHGNHRRR
jgi:hypothetical protein